VVLLYKSPEDYVLNPQNKVNAFVAANQWSCYMNPRVLEDYVLHIRKQIIDILADIYPKVGDRLCACAGLAYQHFPHLKAIQGTGPDIACTETIIQVPLKVTWHFIMMDKNIYLSDVEILPYRGDFHMLKDGHAKC
jgi:hypothetical protein